MTAALSFLKGAGLTLLALGLAFVATFLLFRAPMGESFRLLVAGAFGDRFALSRTLVKTTPLLLCALGLSLAWRAGAYNIGGEGQYVLGGAAGAWLGARAGSPYPILAMGVLGGAAWAGVAALLYRRRGVDPVIGTILLNAIGVLLLGYLVGGPLKDAAGGLPLTPRLPAGAMLPKPDRQTDAHLGTLLAFLLVPAVGFLMRRTGLGYRFDLVGANAAMARANRVDAAGLRAWALVISGGFCGLAGATEYAGVAGQVGDSFAQGWGLLAIPVALLGGRSAWGVALAALGFGALFAGAEDLSRTTPAGPQMALVIQALALLFVLGLRHVRLSRGGRD